MRRDEEKKKKGVISNWWLTVTNSACSAENINKNY
jgi:hypothetical protein